MSEEKIERRYIVEGKKKNGPGYVALFAHSNSHARERARSEYGFVKVELVRENK